MKVFAGKNPFENSHPIAQRVKIIEGGRPPRPVNPSLTDDVWALVRRCWDQEPQLRPGMRSVLQDLASSLLRSLYQSPKSSPEFQVALGQFYDSTESKTCLSRLDAIELKKFVTFLDDVRQLFALFHPNLGHDYSCSDTTEQGVNGRVTTTNPKQPAGGV